MDRMRPARPARLVAALLASTLLGSACTDALGSGGDDGEVEGGATVESWPQVEAVGTLTSPAAPAAEVTVHAPLRSADGFTTLLLDVANGANEDTTLGDLFGYDGIAGVTLYDPEANVEYAPLQIDHEYETGGCLCSTGPVTVPAGGSTQMYVTYAGVPDDVETVRVQPSQFTPLADVPVLDAGVFGDGTGRAIRVENDGDLSIAVESVAPTAEGTLVRLRYANDDSAEPVELSEFPSPGDVSLVDADGSAIFLPRTAEFEPVAGFASEDSLGEGESATAEVLVAGLPDDTDAVVVRAPRMRRSFPVPVAEEEATPTIDVPAALDEEEIYELASPTSRYDAPMVPTDEPELPDTGSSGPDLPVGSVSATLTSDAQPGWSIAVRSVVRGPGAFSTLLVDVTAGAGTTGYWPEGLGADDTTDDLGGITVVDPAGERLYGAYQSDGSALDGGDSYSLDEGETERAYILLPALRDDVRTVTVEVPTFGAAENVPVVDGPDVPANGPVPATMRVRDDAALRMDVLTVSRLGEGNGTLLRARLVNESRPEAVTTPFAGEGEGLCDLRLADPATGDVYTSLAPCAATTWDGSLAQGEGLPFEVRFPDLHEGVEDVVVVGEGWFPAGPVPLGDARPWYLTLPQVADEPAGFEYAAAQGPADGAATTTRVGDTVEVSLATDVLFAFDSVSLDAGAAARIDELAGEVAADAAGGTVTIVGHTDDAGEDAYNQTLSEQRAEAVRAALEPAVGRGDLAYEVSGAGETDPVAPNAVNGAPNPDGQARNRRVTIAYEAESAG
jgi:outer membrane protein OmpA-like peptidoglycan-associated protein